MAAALNIRTLAWVVDALRRTEGLLLDTGIAGHEARRWTGAAIDSRAECSGRLFFALKGEKTDGHLFARNAYQSGCVATIIEDKELFGALTSDGVSCLLVTSCLKALQELARAYRRGIDVRVIAITGSTGKTSTKEYVYKILKTKHRVFSSPGNFNNLIGVPLTILETETDNEYLVCEVGANHAGEIGFLGEMLVPEIGVITNIGDAHLGMFGSVDDIARAKGELLDNLEPAGYAVLPRDDVYFEQLNSRSPAKTVTFGTSDKSDFVVTNIEWTAGKLVFTVNGEAMTLHALGEYNALNACAAIAVGDLCGVEPARTRTALGEITPMPGRGRIHSGGGVTLIDESYNASPASMRVSLDMLSRLGVGRRLAVLGDMKELGDFASSKHEEMGGVIARLPIDRAYWLGTHGSDVRRGFEKGGGKIPLGLHSEIGKLADEVEAELAPGDTVLVKASRACALDVFVARVLKKIDSSPEN